MKVKLIKEGIKDEDCFKVGDIVEYSRDDSVEIVVIVTKPNTPTTNEFSGILITHSERPEHGIKGVENWDFKQFSLSKNTYSISN